MNHQSGSLEFIAEDTKRSLTLPRKTILFVCMGNRCRSVLAEAILKKLTCDTAPFLSIRSAGLMGRVGIKPTKETIKILKELGIDENHDSQMLTNEMVRAADVIFVMEKKHSQLICERFPSAQYKIKMLSHYLLGDDFQKQEGIPDPFGKSPLFYTNVAEIIHACCNSLAQELIAAN